MVKSAWTARTKTETPDTRDDGLEASPRLPS
jgi:hypothetical protein